MDKDERNAILVAISPVLIGAAIGAIPPIAILAINGFAPVPIIASILTAGVTIRTGVAVSALITHKYLNKKWEKEDKKEFKALRSNHPHSKANSPVKKKNFSFRHNSKNVCDQLDKIESENRAETPEAPSHRKTTAKHSKDLFKI